MSVQQEQSAFLRILSGTVRKQASMARGMRLHNAKCAIQQQEMAMEHAPARKKYIARASSVERRVGNDRKGTHSYEFGNKKPITFSYTVVLVTTAPTIHDTIPSCHLYSPPSSWCTRTRSVAHSSGCSRPQLKRKKMVGPQLNRPFHGPQLNRPTPQKWPQLKRRTFAMPQLKRPKMLRAPTKATHFCDAPTKTTHFCDAPTKATDIVRWPQLKRY